jgi:hypothetical protein
MFWPCWWYGWLLQSWLYSQKWRNCCEKGHLHMVLGKNFHPETHLEQMYGIQSEERKWRHDLVPIIRRKYHTWKGNMIITTHCIYKWLKMWNTCFFILLIFDRSLYTIYIILSLSPWVGVRPRIKPRSDCKDWTQVRLQGLNPGPTARIKPRSPSLKGKKLMYP